MRFHHAFQCRPWWFLSQKCWSDSSHWLLYREGLQLQIWCSWDYQPAITGVQKGERSNISLNISICFHHFMIRLLTRTWPRGRIREDTLGVSPLPTPGWSRTFPSAQTWDIQVGQPSPAALRAGDLCPMWPGNPGIVGGGNWGYPVINGIIDSGILRGFILFNGD